MQYVARSLSTRSRSGKNSGKSSLLVERMNEYTLDVGQAFLNVATSLDRGRPLVCLHGVSRRWQDFIGVHPALLGRWHVVSPDMRGHGKSSRAEGAYRVIDYVADIAALLARSFQGPAVLFGHSLGAMVAAGVAARVPERVRAVVLEDPPFEMMGRYLGDTSYPSIFEAYESLAGSHLSVEELAGILARTPVRGPGDLQPRLMGETRDEISLRFVASCLKQLDPAVLKPVLAGRWLEGYDVESTLAKVACPALFLQADFAAGGTLPEEYANELVGLMPRCLRVRFPGVGHQIHGTKPEEMMRIVTTFLETID